MKRFEEKKEILSRQFEAVEWDPESGLSKEELEERFAVLMENKAGLSRAMLKAETYRLLAEHSRIAVDREDVFQDKLFAGDFVLRQRKLWEQEVVDTFLSREAAEKDAAWLRYGSYRADRDFSHTSPNSECMLRIGIVGLLERIQRAAAQEGRTESQLDFYRACQITLEAFLRYLARLSQGIRPYNEENAEALLALTHRPPETCYEAMQLLIAYFFFHEFMGKTRVRTLGRLDVLLAPFYQKDRKRGCTKEEIKELLRYFLNKFWAAKVPYDLPFCLGGLDAEGREVTGEVSVLIVETYDEMKIHSPKIHIRVSEKTPDSFLKQVLACIRGGNSSFVFVQDRIAIRGLEAVGIAPKDAINYVPIGCYEPAVWGVEMGCTGNGGVNLAKAVEMVVTGGVDWNSGERCGPDPGEIHSYEEFVSAVKAQIAYFTQRVMSYVVKIEAHYGKINPDPFLSAQYDHSVELGKDVYEGGARYNNSSIYFWCLASLVDSVAAVKKLVYEDGDVTFEELCRILKNNWEGAEALRQKAWNVCEKYGNNGELTNGLIQEFSEYVASLSNGKPNGRGGVFKSALFSIDRYVTVGKKTMATPDGRFAGEVLSKNLCATAGKDKNGITALIHSVSRIDCTKFPNGSVLDVVLHPSAVQGEEGLSAFLGLLKTYFYKGGLALHGNVFSAEDLKKAQKDPRAYETLQVRVCGWNAYFVKLKKEEQDAFIRQAEING